MSAVYSCVFTKYREEQPVKYTVNGEEQSVKKLQKMQITVKNDYSRIYLSNFSDVL